MCINTLAGAEHRVWIVCWRFLCCFWFHFSVAVETLFFDGFSDFGGVNITGDERASEEAIRSVPQTYKEASLGLGPAGCERL